jgi:uncharacterized protein YkwD
MTGPLLKTSLKHWQLFWKCWAAAVSTSFLLSGCLVIPIDFPARPPQENRSTGDRPTSDTPAQSATLAQMEVKVRQQINQIRQEHGLKQLQANEKLAKVARAYSHQMAEKNFFSHTGPDGRKVAQRVHSAGISYWVVGENLFKCTNAPDPVSLGIKGWMDSPGHRENILRPEYTQTGVGIWRTGNTYYFTQLFLRPLF